MASAVSLPRPETGRAYARARELCGELGDVPELFPVLYGQYVFHFQRGELAEGRGDMPGDLTELPGSETRAHEAREVFLPSALEERLCRHRLDRFDTPDRFHEKGVGLGPPLSALFHRPTQERRHHEPRLAEDDQEQDRVDPQVIVGDELGEMLVEMQDEVDEPGDQFHGRAQG